LLFRFSEQLHREPIHKDTFDLYSELGQKITIERDSDPVFDKIDKLYENEMIHLELIENSNGLKRAEATISGLNRPRLITLHISGNTESLPFYFLGYIQTQGDGKYVSHYGTRGHGGSSTGEKPGANNLV
jgi:hypothetical protein